MINAAKHLSSGCATRIDIWSRSDLSGNSKALTLANVAAEGVADRVRIVDGDACNLPFADGTFDIVRSSFVVHNIPKHTDRERALREMLRVLKPGGLLLVQDFQATLAYKNVFEQAGLAKRVERSSLCWLVFPPARTVKVIK